MSRRNPILDLPAAKRLADLPHSARVALREVLRELGQQAEEQAQLSWKRRKGPMAAYYMAVGVYARHVARAIPEGEPTLPLGDTECACQGKGCADCSDDIWYAQEG